MNIKAYIDFFSEIADMERSQQFIYLERAEAEASRHFKMPIFTVIAFGVPVFVAIIVVALVIMLSVSTLILFILVVVGLLVSRITVSELNARVLRKSLNVVIDAEHKA